MGHLAVDRSSCGCAAASPLAERPYASASSDRRMWYGYSACQPQNLAMVLTISGVAHYCLPDKEGKTQP